MGEQNPSADAMAAERAAQVPSCAKLFTEFARMGLSGFGGVLPFARRGIVERNGWLSDAEFAEMLSLGQVLPGPNVVNLSVMLGYRYHGVRGAASAMAGLVAVPAVLLLLIVMLYDHYSALPLVQHLLKGMGAVAAGLVLATAIKLAQGQSRTWRAAVIGLAVFLAIGVLQWPLLPVMAVLIPLALVLEWRATR
ncbi:MULTISPECIES: chromate transporter [Ralstonia solanacearum species complex]|uniref:Chromate transporter n=1 Tax=Ralstonia syzygii TaxID=28097 RepID=A0ABX7ZGM2_9RALS|nr:MULTISPECIES: chromate transporter [Ralstonia solanacearum species complex]BEU72743.1 chromate transporter [Ralstonia pseudosolanacearum]AMP38180.1 chromate transporter [Ralstonia solanacearum]AXV77579.1 chromate transporter [Ralstonia solanacearum]AXV87006.1 chromate transporter [Ralstonia solanacearum]AXV91601.1 chromate transporter [Ralstonia solanacearum]